jgi:spermidine synthase
VREDRSTLAASAPANLSCPYGFSAHAERTWTLVGLLDRDPKARQLLGRARGQFLVCYGDDLESAVDPEHRLRLPKSQPDEALAARMAHLLAHVVDPLPALQPSTATCGDWLEQVRVREDQAHQLENEIRARNRLPVLPSAVLNRAVSQYQTRCVATEASMRPAAPVRVDPRQATAARGHVVFEKRSPFSLVEVTDDGDSRSLWLGGPDSPYVQSTMSLSHPDRVLGGSTRLAALGLLERAELERVMMVGLGGGRFTSLLRRLFPDVSVDVVEIDPVVVEAATTYFGVQPGPRLRIHIEDGSAFVQRTTQRYDLIFLDAYSGHGLPQHLTTTAFYRTVAGKLTSGGVALANLVVAPEPEAELEQRFRAVFPHVHCARSATGAHLALIGATRPLRNPKELELRAQQLSVRQDPSFDLAAEARRVAERCPRLR